MMQYQVDLSKEELEWLYSTLNLVSECRPYFEEKYLGVSSMCERLISKFFKVLYNHNIDRKGMYSYDCTVNAKIQYITSKN